MKWFKHYNNMLSKPYMEMLLDKHGTAGTHAWMRLLEILARDFDPKAPGIYEASKRKILSDIFPCVGNKTGIKILDFFQLMTDFSYEIEGKIIRINCPEIRRLAADYMKQKSKGDNEEKY